MENKTVLSMGTMSRKYSENCLVAIGATIILLIIGVTMLYMGNSYRTTDTSAVLIGIFACWLGVEIIIIAFGNYVKRRKALNTKLEVTSDEIRGVVNSKDFAVNVEEVVSTVVRRCSVDCDSHGNPKELNSDFFARLHALDNEYLCIHTSSGKTFYIDCLTSPEVAKTTIDFLITRNK